jgi:hypothetical protein
MFHNETYVKIKEEYSDRVNFVFSHLPLPFHENAMPAAKFAQCA